MVQNSLNLEKSQTAESFWDFSLEKIIINSSDSRAPCASTIKGRREAEQRAALGRAHSRGYPVSWKGAIYKEKRWLSINSQLWESRRKETGEFKTLWHLCKVLVKWDANKWRKVGWIIIKLRSNLQHLHFLTSGICFFSPWLFLKTFGLYIYF